MRGYAAALGATLLSASGCHSGPSLPACPGGNEIFTVSPLDPADFTGLVPLGNLNPPGHTFPTDHLYFYVRRQTPGDWATPPAAVPVVSPGHLWITSVASSEHLSASPPYTDYTIEAQPCADVGIQFGHVEALDAGLAARLGPISGSCQQYSTGGQTYRNCRQAVNVEVAAGDAIGTAGGVVGQNALDVGGWDLRTAPMAYANPTRLDGQRLHIVCPVDYFAQPVRDALRSRFGDYLGAVLRTAEPRCGEVMQDVPGTAQGKWYRAATPTSPEDPHLALVHDNVDPTRAAFSVGTSVPGLGPGVLAFFPTSAGQVGRDFRDVVPGSIYCWDLTGGRAILQLTSATALQLQFDAGASCGAGPWTLGPAAVAFER